MRRNKPCLQPIKNRYDFVILFDVENGNPNGDPDAGNMPRIDPETGYGLVTDVCLKRKIRNYVETLKEDEKADTLPHLHQGRRSSTAAMPRPSARWASRTTWKSQKSDPDIDAKLRDYMCEHFYDIRTFGAVMTTFVRVR